MNQRHASAEPIQSGRIYLEGDEITRKGAATFVFTPRPTDMTTVLVPDEREAFAALVASFGMPEVLATWEAPATSWTVPQLTEATALAHLRDWHGTMERGTTSHLVGSTAEALRYHWQVHQQQLVMPLPRGHHVHAGG